MSPTVLKRIAMVLGVVLVAWGGFALLGRYRRDDTGTLVLPRVTPAAAERIAFRKGGDTIVLVRQGDRWSVNGLPGSTRSVDAFLLALGDSTLRSEMVAQRTASHQRLGVDSASRRLTIDTAGKTVLDLRLGNRGPDFEGLYVRSEGSDVVYLLGGQFAEMAGRGLADWRDKQMAAIVPDSVARVQVVRGRTSWSLTRNGPAWGLSRGPADSASVARFLAHFDDLRATGFPEPGDLDSIRFDPPDRAVTLYGAAGQPFLALQFDSTSGGSFWVRAASGGPVYRLDGRATELATPSESTLKKK